MSEEENSYDREREQEELNSEVIKIASTMGTRNYFLAEQERNLDEWALNASEIFRTTGDVLISEYELKSSSTLDSYQGAYEDNYARCRKEFDAFCILNRKVQKKNDEIENLAAHLNQKNSKKTFFNGWKAYSDHRKYLRRMEDEAKKYQERRCMKLVLKNWLQITMENTKTKIKNEVLQRTEMQVSRIQTEYQRLIKTMEETLQKKLNELRKEEEEHKQLHDKYENMYSRAKVSQGSSRG